MKKSANVHVLVRKAYARIALAQVKPSCCAKPGPSNQPVPESDLGVSCGDPVAFSEIRPGDVVLDLGSGGGKDVFLAAMRVGPKGKAIGLDMTPEMLALARKNAAKFRARTGLRNVAFRKGRIEKLPLKNGSVDLVISNCVINLSPDKPQVFREIHRVLKSGGRMVVSDIVLTCPLPKALRDDEALYAGCIAGALPRKDYLRAIRQAGFRTVKLLGKPQHFALSKGAAGGGCCGENDLRDLAMSITVKAGK